METAAGFSGRSDKHRKITHCPCSSDGFARAPNPRPSGFGRQTVTATRPLCRSGGRFPGLSPFVGGTSEDGLHGPAVPTGASESDAGTGRAVARVHTGFATEPGPGWRKRIRSDAAFVNRHRLTTAPSHDTDRAHRGCSQSRRERLDIDGCLRSNREAKFFTNAPRSPAPPCAPSPRPPCAARSGRCWPPAPHPPLPAAPRRPGHRASPPRPRRSPESAPRR